MSKDLIKLDVAGFVAEIRGFAGKLDELLAEAERMAQESHVEHQFNDPDDWRECGCARGLADLIAEIRPVVEKAKAIDGGQGPGPTGE